MLNDYLRAWHGGIGKWGNMTDINSSSIGIEIDNNGFEAFTDPQMNSLLRVLDTLKRRHGIPAANFIGHSDIAPTRKVDPNVNFSWQTLAKRGFGLWYDEVRDTLPNSFNSIHALRIIGYDTKDSIAAIGAFKRKFLQQDKSKELNDEDKRILYNLMKKSL
jgi:N-acetylmuramoyl-L-alanine amidase